MSYRESVGEKGYCAWDLQYGISACFSTFIIRGLSSVEYYVGKDTLILRFTCVGYAVWNKCLFFYAFST